MKSLLEYKNLIMSTGLIPAIVCMIFCIFFQDAVVLYVCSLASIIYILYRLVKPPVYQPNLVLHFQQTRQLSHLGLHLRQLLGKGAVLTHPLANLFDALKIHHFQRRQRGVGVGRGEKS